MKVKIILSLIIIAVFVFVGKFVSDKNTIISDQDLKAIYEKATISNDKKSILDQDGNVILNINTNNFLGFYKEIVCQEHSVLNIEGYCADGFPREKLERSLSNAYFSEIKQSGDNKKIAFKIHIPGLGMPLTGLGNFEEALGLFNFDKNKLMLLGGYTGSLLDFSPNGKYIAYIPGCLEGDCDIFIADTENLEKISGVGSKSSDYGEVGYLVKFVKWSNNDTVEYNETNWGGKILEKKFLKIDSKNKTH